MTEKIINRIEALLRKAESTNSDEERETLSAKAEELMIKYSIDQAMLDPDRNTEDQIVSVQTHIRGIYQMIHMSSALSVVQAMGARGYYSDLRRLNKTVVVTVIDFESTIGLVQRMVDSTLAQSMMSMGFWWTANKNEWAASQGYMARRSFLEGFGRGVADRIRREREEAVAEVSETSGGELVLARDRKLDDAVAPLGLVNKSSRHRSARDARTAGFVDGQRADINRKASVTA